MKDLQEELVRLEDRLNSSVSACELTRVFAPKQGKWWSLGIGGIGMPKAFFTGPSVADLIVQAHKYLDKIEEANGHLDVFSPGRHTSVGAVLNGCYIETSDEEKV